VILQQVNLQQPQYDCNTTVTSTTASSTTTTPNLRAQAKIRFLLKQVGAQKASWHSKSKL
jgi:hypothetical protein